MGGRYLRLAKARSREGVGRETLQPWRMCAFLLAMCVLIALGIYIGLHSRILGPDY